MLTKIKLKEQIDKMPEDFSIDELIEKLILIEKIESGNKQSENGEVITEDELENEIERWFK
jgi:predicted transcriptional regulator